jgi:LacI family transcriptional regulator
VSGEGSARAGGRGPGPATYKDIQRVTGLSLATISKHFNGGTVREPNRLAIDAAARDLGFRVNAVARSLRTRRSRTVGVLVPELDNDFHLSVVAGVERAFSARAISVLVCSARRSGGSGGAAELLDRQVDGIVAVPSAGELDALRRAASLAVPLVLVDRVVPDLVCDAVVLDNAGASQRVLDDLVAHGHRELAVLAGPDDLWSLRERREGFRAAARAAGVPLGRDAVVTCPLTVEGGRAGMRRLLARRRRPTAVYATNHELTLGALTALAEADVDVPGEVSLVGFDAPSVAALTRPRTAVLVQPVREIASAAADLMLDRLEPGEGREAPPRRLVLAGRYVGGGSVGAPGR